MIEALRPCDGTGYAAHEMLNFKMNTETKTNSSHDQFKNGDPCDHEMQQEFDGKKKLLRATVLPLQSTI